jgi:hypothetical protein
MWHSVKYSISVWAANWPESFVILWLDININRKKYTGQIAW